MATKIYVGGLSVDVAEEDIRKLFSNYGSVGDIDIDTDQLAEVPSKRAFVRMESAQEAQKAMASLNGKDLLGRKLHVNQARIMQDTGASGVGRRSF